MHAGAAIPTLGTAMPTRATKRGADRTPIDHDCDVLICGASFAGLVGRARAGRSRRQR